MPAIYVEPERPQAPSTSKSKFPSRTEMERLPDGRLQVKVETGEVFTGTPSEVILALADSKVHTGKEFIKLKAENKELRNQLTQLNLPPNLRSSPAQAATPPAPQVDARDKLSRDFYGTEYNTLTPDKQAEVSSLHGGLVNDAPDHPYLKAGLTFIQARHLLLETYREELTNRYPQEIQTALADFRTGLEKDIDEAAKRAGFYPEYSQANHALKMATAPPHNSRQGLPMTARR